VPGPILDESFSPEVRHHVVALTAARLTANACYRFAPPFLAVIARDLDVTLGQLGVALAISEIAGLTSPLIGHVVDRVHRRTAMAGGLAGVGIGAALASAATGRVLFAVALVVLAQSKVVFDLGLASWVTDHVEPARRGRVIGITETSWALGLLVGVTTLGLLAAATSWRAGYVGGALAVLAMAAATWVRLRADPIDHAGEHGAGEHGAGEHGADEHGADEHAAEAVRAAPVPPAPTVPRARHAVWPFVAGAAALMAASQCVFVTFGSWLKDEFGFGAARLSATTFLLGGVELVASVTAARRTDAWGAERSAIGGALVMVPAMVLLAMAHSVLVPGLALLAITLVGFEFAIVSALPIGTRLVPGAPAKGLGLMIGAGTAGRAVMSVGASRLYGDGHLAPPMLLGAGAATLCAVAFVYGHRRALAD